MEFTFGIITDGNNHGRLLQVIESIVANNIPNYQIIVVGGNRIQHEKVLHINFSEAAKPSWITRKKNLITQNAKYKNIVFLHDYIVLDPTWYETYVEFGDNFNICINPLLNPDGSRYRDLSFFPAFRSLQRCGIPSNNNSDLFQRVPNMGEHECLIPYDNFKECKELTQWMYISGAYWVAKREVMKKYPLCETLSWGQGEDVLWSEQVKGSYMFSFNKKAVCRLLKQKDPVFKILSENTVKHLQSVGMLL